MTKSSFELKEELRQQPTNLQIRRHLAIQLQKEKKFHEAIFEFNQLLNTFPNDDFIHSNLARLFWQTAQNDLADFHARQCIALNPKNHFAYMTLAEVQLKKGRHEDAISNLVIALNMASDKIFALRRLTTILKFQNRLSDAEKHIRHSLALDPDNAEIKAMLNEINPAANAMAHVQKSPQDDFHLMEQLRKQLEQKPPLEVISQLQKLSRLDQYKDKASVYLLLGQALKKLNRFAEACTAYATAVKLDPASEFCRKQYGFALMKTNDFQTAIQIFEPIVIKEPADQYVLGALAQAYLATHSPEKAQLLLIKALAHFPNDQRLRQLLMKCRQVPATSYP